MDVLQNEAAVLTALVGDSVYVKEALAEMEVREREEKRDFFL